MNLKITKQKYKSKNMKRFLNNVTDVVIGGVGVVATAATVGVGVAFVGAAVVVRTAEELVLSPATISCYLSRKNRYKKMIKIWYKSQSEQNKQNINTYFYPFITLTSIDNKLSELTYFTRKNDSEELKLEKERKKKEIKNIPLFLHQYRYPWNETVHTQEEFDDQMNVMLSNIVAGNHLDEFDEQIKND